MLAAGSPEAEAVIAFAERVLGRIAGFPLGVQFLNEWSVRAVRDEVARTIR